MFSQDLTVEVFTPQLVHFDCKNIFLKQSNKRIIMCLLCKFSPPVQVCNCFAYKFYVFMFNKILKLHVYYKFVIKRRIYQGGGRFVPDCFDLCYFLTYKISNLF